VCLHPERVRIELALAKGRGRKALAPLFNLHPDAVGRHWRLHVDAALKEKHVSNLLKAEGRLEQVIADTDVDVLERLSGALAEAEHAYTQAMNARQFSAAASLMGQRTTLLKEIAKLSGQAKKFAGRGTDVKLLAVNPEFVTWLRAIEDALAPWPEARRAVSQRLSDLAAAEAKPGPVMIEGQADAA
jgi:hypothetical protein